ncbi:MAG: class I SAM-dependent methyltransferase [Sphingomonadales bacterium]|nr:class I SAM-dependent methyltransferase [Sphingomonadales bacterium]
MTKLVSGDLTSRVIGWGERTALPDALTRAGIWMLCKRTARRLALQGRASERAFVAEMASFAIAEHAASANEQHYELPAEFFGFTLGTHRKYSCCYYPEKSTTLAEAEGVALAETLKRARLGDGQDILELGCGWGSLSLYMAEHLPRARITAVSNSVSQRAYIEDVARQRGLNNLAVVSADMNDFESDATFDRIVSVEMFEHMANWHALLARARRWLKPEGRMFIHIFAHSSASYRFDHRNPADWIAQHFFTGGIMPGEKLIWHFPEHFDVEEQWRWSGTHYARTARDWLANFDRNIVEIRRILLTVYGKDARLWERRWRLFFLATSGLFGHRNGAVWGVSHYRLKPVA